MAVLQSLISPWKRKGKKGKKKLLQHGVFVFGLPPKYQRRRTGLNFVETTKHVAVLVVYKKIVTLRWTHFVKFLRWEKVQKRHIWYCMAGKAENKKLEEHENEDYYLLWWSDKPHFPYNSLGLSGEDNSVSRTDNFVIVNVFNSVISSRVTGNQNFARKEELLY